MYYRNIFSWTYYWKISRYVGLMHRTGCLFWAYFSSFFLSQHWFCLGLRSRAEVNFGKESPSLNSGILLLTRLRQLYIHHEMLREETCSGSEGVWWGWLSKTKKIWEGFSPLIKNKNYTLGENAQSCHWLWDYLGLKQSSCAHELKERKSKQDNSESWHCCVDKLIIPGLCTWLSPTPIFIVVKYT